MFIYKIFNLVLKEVALNGFLSDDAPKGLDKIQKLISKFGSNGFSVRLSMNFFSSELLNDMFIELLNYIKKGWRTVNMGRFILVRNHI